MVDLIGMGKASIGPVTAAPRRATRAQRTWLWVHRNLDKWGTPLALWIYRRTRGGIARGFKVDVLLLTTRGRRSGKRRTVMLQYFSDGDTMLITAANGGSPRLPAWYHNLTAAPDASVEVGDRTIPVRAEAIPADEEERWWGRIARHDPNYALYRRATSRRFPVVRLVPRRDGNDEARRHRS